MILNLKHYGCISSLRWCFLAPGVIKKFIPIWYNLVPFYQCYCWLKVSFCRNTETPFENGCWLPYPCPQASCVAQEPCQEQKIWSFATNNHLTELSDISECQHSLYLSQKQSTYQTYGMVRSQKALERHKDHILSNPMGNSGNPNREFLLPTMLVP